MLGVCFTESITGIRLGVAFCFHEIVEKGLILIQCITVDSLFTSLNVARDDVSNEIDDGLTTFHVIWILGNSDDNSWTAMPKIIVFLVFVYFC